MRRNAEKRTTRLLTMNTRVLRLSELAWNHLLRSLIDRDCLIDQSKVMYQLSIPPRFRARAY
jgi:hypothetical protein